MTMWSFRIDDAEDALARRWAERLGMDRSQLIREALHRHLVRLAAEDDISTWLDRPLDKSERSFGAIADWGPAEDWSDWRDAEDDTSAAG